MMAESEILMEFSGAIDDGRGAAVDSSSSQPFGAYHYRTTQPAGRVVRLEIPLPAPHSAAFLLLIVALHALLLWAIANSDPRMLARVIAPIAVRFMPLPEQDVPPDPPMLPAAALELQMDSLLQEALPPSVMIDAFESESQAISTGFVAPKKELPEPTMGDIVEEEEDGAFVRPRPIRGRMGKQAYPSGAAAAGESGRATVKICITARGTIESVEIMESTGFQRLDNDALDVASQYRFRPATRNGKAIPVCLPYSINYRIN
jgi:protein TonB